MQDIGLLRVPHSRSEDISGLDIVANVGNWGKVINKVWERSNMLANFITL